MNLTSDNLIVSECVQFSLEIMKYCDKLYHDRKFIISYQLLRAATSIGANVFEAQSAESKRDFVHKMKIACKEATETIYWLSLCEKSDNSFPLILKEKAFRLFKILSKIIATSKKNLDSQLEKSKKTNTSQ